MSLPLPPLEEQKHIVAKVDQFMTLCDQLEARLKNAQEEGKTQLAAVVVSILRLMLMNSVQAKLEASRQELLDLGLRNKLISYRPLKTRGVEIVDELPEHVYQILVQADRAMYFLPKPSPETENDKDIAEQMDWFALPEDDEERDFDRHIDYRLQTGYSLAELQRRLLNTYYTARTYIEEQGVNTLYLALGMLQWYESPSSEIQRQAPLVLVPVELKRTSVRARFHVRYTGEDLGTNLSLQARVESDFSVRLPSLPEDDELDLPHYFQEVDFAVLCLPRWSVDTSAITLGFFRSLSSSCTATLTPKTGLRKHLQINTPYCSPYWEPAFKNQILSLVMTTTSTNTSIQRKPITSSMRIVRRRWPSVM